MNIAAVSEEILSLVGGKENVTYVTNCVTRLRFVLKDNAKADDEKIKAIKGVISVVRSGEQYQVVIGGEAADLAKELNSKYDFSKGGAASEEKTEKEGNPFTRVLSVIAGIFIPVIPALAGGGLLKALLSLLTFAGWMDTAGSTYIILNAMSDAVYYFLPVMLAFSAARKFKCNEFLAAALGSLLLHPQFMNLLAGAKEAGTAVTLFGLPVTIATYSSTVVPAILTIWFMSYVEKYASKIIPASMRMIFVPLVVVLIVTPVEVCLLAPLGNILSGYLSSVVTAIDSFAPWLVTTLVGTFMPFLVMFGMHYGIIPLGIQSLSTTGYDTIAGPGMQVSNMAQGGASIGAALRSKDKEFKSLAFSTGLSGVMGITEPAMYGISLPYKRPLYAAMAAGGISGFFLGIFHVGRYAQAAPGLLALPSYLGGDSMRIFYLACIGTAMAFILSTIFSYLMWNDNLLKKDARETTGNTAPAAAPVLNTAVTIAQDQVVNAPAKGTILALHDVNDPVFSQGLMGKGSAIKLSEGKIYAPVSGTVTTLFPTLHAVGITGNDGAEILIHVGVDTVNLQGKGFKAHVSQNQSVKAGDLLLDVDLDLLKKEGYDSTTMVIVTNTNDFAAIETDNGECAPGMKLMSLHTA